MWGHVKGVHIVQTTNRFSILCQMLKKILNIENLPEVSLLNMPYSKKTAHIDRHNNLRKFQLSSQY